MNQIVFHDDSLFEGVITHARKHPFNHSFKYYATYFWLDIKNPQENLLFKKNKFSLFSFNERDHGKKRRKETLFKSIVKNLKKLENTNIDHIKILCLPDILGYSFNPISVFVGFDKYKRAKIVIFEVNNTFNERHSYYCRISEKKKSFFFKKRLYVSPFFKVKGLYEIKLKMINKRISLNIDYEVSQKKVFCANFSGKAIDLNYSNLINVFFKRSFQNIKITFGIYYQALKLYIKGAKYSKKPFKPINDFTIIK